MATLPYVGEPKTEPTWFDKVIAQAKDLRPVAEAVAKTLIIAIVLAAMVWVGWLADPGTKARLADRLLVWSFVVFAVGLAALFVLFVIMSVLGKIDLAEAFADKTFEEVVRSPDKPPAKTPSASSGESDSLPTHEARHGESPPTQSFASPAKDALKARPSISLARLQAFMWTLIVMISYFHRVARDPAGPLPTIPPELLTIMGISGAVYLTSKNIDRK